jgi:O-antigen/teichoic acid export membrane protein
MKTIRTYHWTITGALFLIAILLYITGFGTGAAAMVFFGFVVETAAWISLFFHHSRRPGGDAGSARR